MIDDSHIIENHIIDTILGKNHIIDTILGKNKPKKTERHVS